MIGETLKKLRREINKTQAEVAEELSLQKQTYQNYELDKRQPDILMLKKLADYFHTSVDYIVGHEVPYLINKSHFSYEQLSILEEIKTLDRLQCQNLLAYIKGLKDGKLF